MFVCGGFYTLLLKPHRDVVVRLRVTH